MTRESYFQNYAKGPQNQNFKGEPPKKGINIVGLFSPTKMSKLLYYQKNVCTKFQENQSTVLNPQKWEKYCWIIFSSENVQDIIKKRFLPNFEKISQQF